MGYIVVIAGPAGRRPELGMDRSLKHSLHHISLEYYMGN